MRALYGLVWIVWAVLAVRWFISGFRHGNRSAGRLLSWLTAIVVVWSTIRHPDVWSGLMLGFYLGLCFADLCVKVPRWYGRWLIRRYLEERLQERRTAQKGDDS